jgi:hypothetical protein
LIDKDGTVDWEAAAKAYDPNVKVASFKTVTMKALSRAKKAIADGGGTATTSTDGNAGAEKPKTPRKRKATTPADEGGEKPKAKRAAKGAKWKKNGGDAAVSGEGSGAASEGEGGSEAKVKEEAEGYD